MPGAFLPDDGLPPSLGGRRTGVLLIVENIRERGFSFPLAFWGPKKENINMTMPFTRAFRSVLLRTGSAAL